jgi:hypothetical protein
LSDAVDHDVNNTNPPSLWIIAKALTLCAHPARRLSELESSCDTTNLQADENMEPLRKKQKAGAATSANALGQQRERALRHWYQDTNNSYPAIRQRAQARLQLQIHIRAIRKAVKKWKARMRVAEAGGRSQEIDDISKKLAGNVTHLRLWETALHNEFSPSNKQENRMQSLAAAWCKSYIPPLDKILKDAEQDKDEDFPRDPSQDLCATPGSQTHSGLQLMQDREGDDREDRMVISDSTSGVAKDHIDRRPETPASPLELDPTFSTIWDRYHCFMTQRSMATSMASSITKAKLALQKEVFQRHAQLELAARTAHNITSFMTADKSEAHLKTSNTHVRTGRVQARGVWKLASTQLWSHLEDTDYWKWTPEGYLSIETSFDGLSNIHLDFGHRTFNVGNVALPEYVRTHPLPLKATCSETGENVFMGLTPLANGFVKIHMPARAILPVDQELEMTTSAKNVVELVGVSAGQTDIV